MDVVNFVVGIEKGATVVCTVMGDIEQTNMCFQYSVHVMIFLNLFNLDI